jgi:hypothetical protein
MKQDYSEGVDYMALTQQQLENIQIDYGIVYVNYGETDQALLGPTRGGGTFIVTKNIREIEFDGRRGKSKGAQVVDEINAQLNVTHLDTSMQTLKLAMPYATFEGDGSTTPYTITCKSSNVGVIPSTAYLKNITMFAKTVKGEYKKITLYNAMTENDFNFAAVPKGEGTIAMEVYAHWDPTDDTKDLYKVEDAASIE